MSEQEPISLKAEFSGFAPELVTVTLGYKNGGSIVKKVKYNDFITMLNDSVEEGGTVVSFSNKNWGGIPDGLIDIAYQDESNFLALLQVPAELFIVQYCGEKYSIPFPSLLFAVKVVGQRVTGTRVYAVKDTKVTSESVLYHYPFGNVYADGHICWGGNSLPTVEGVKDAFKVPQIFYSAPTNSDLWKSEERVDIEKLGNEPILSKVYAFLNGQKEFPLDALMPTKFKVEQLFNI